jgi:hypothetical protein
LWTIPYRNYSHCNPYWGYVTRQLSRQLGIKDGPGIPSDRAWAKSYALQVPMHNRIKCFTWAPVDHTGNPSYLRGWDQEDSSLRPA